MEATPSEHRVSAFGSVRWYHWGVALSVLTFAAVLAMLAFSPSHALPLGVVEVTGESMEPTAHEGDLLIYVETGRYERGDWILFPSLGEPGWTAHRIAREPSSGKYVTAGDNPEYPQTDLYYTGEYVREDDVAGEVVLHVPTSSISRHF